MQDSPSIFKNLNFLLLFFPTCLYSFLLDCDMYYRTTVFILFSFTFTFWEYFLKESPLEIVYLID